MVDRLTIDVAGKAFVEFPKLTEKTRARMRSEIPFLTKKLADRVRQKLAPGALFKTTTRILPAVKSEMVENTKEIYGRVYIDKSMFPNVVAHTLESGSRAHEIAAKNASALFFFWPRLGANVAFKRVWHPGFPGRSYMQSSLDELKADLAAQLSNAVTKELKG